ncbi:MAG: TolC family protein [Bacteroidota bacterium]|nr:TolC family protein [Bacteroidota bacterium]
MKKTNITMALILLLALKFGPVNAQQTPADSAWSLQKCIQYALKENISVRKSGLVTETNQVNADQAKALRYPSVNASIGQNFGWSRSFSAGGFGSYSNSNNTNYAVNSSVTLYNGNRIQNNMKQTDLMYQAGQYDTETTKENISLNILNAYLQVLYAEEAVKNAEKQIVSTTEQLRLADERLQLGAISKSDYLTVKSELASEKQTLANAQSTLAIDKVALMQLMDLPVTSSFSIVHPDFGTSINKNQQPVADEVYKKALGIKPQVKSAELNQQIAALNVEMAKGSQMPLVSLSGGLSTGYSNAYTGIGYGSQVGNRITPTLGLSVSIPIYQNKELRSKISIAQIGTKTAELSTLDTRNQLRKSIEQACVDVTSAEQQFEASLDGFDAATESYNVADEKLKQGVINSVDFLIQKTSLITAESKLLQAKYNLIFSYKTLDFYTGASLTL